MTYIARQGGGRGQAFAAARVGRTRKTAAGTDLLGSPSLPRLWVKASTHRNRAEGISSPYPWAELGTAVLGCCFTPPYLVATDLRAGVRPGASVHAWVSVCVIVPV